MSNKKRYTVKITEFAEEKTLTGREFKKGVEPTTDEKPDGYGYTPQVKQILIVEREIFSQNTDSLDLKTVIKAINGL